MRVRVALIETARCVEAARQRIIETALICERTRQLRAETLLASTRQVRVLRKVTSPADLQPGGGERLP